jgi:hypothetical protein
MTRYYVYVDFLENMHLFFKCLVFDCYMQGKGIPALDVDFMCVFTVLKRFLDINVFNGFGLFIKRWLCKLCN